MLLFWANPFRLNTDRKGSDTLDCCKNRFCGDNIFNAKTGFSFKKLSGPIASKMIRLSFKEIRLWAIFLIGLSLLYDTKREVLSSWDSRESGSPETRNYCGPVPGSFKWQLQTTASSWGPVAIKIRSCCSGSFEKKGSVLVCLGKKQGGECLSFSCFQVSSPALLF